MSKLVVVDGNSIMNRAFYGLSGKNMLTNKEGIPTNALFGFLNILFKLISDDNPEYMAVAFDLKAPTFRHKMYSEYKAGRHAMPEELKTQMPIIKEILDDMNITRIEKEGYEADDIIGTIAKKAKKEGIDVIVFTGDRDSFQLIEDGILVKLPSTHGGKTETEDYDTKKILEKYGVEPLKLIEVKGLMGDSSDNIPGVKGVGEKTALKYIEKFGTIENLYENINDSVITEKMRNLLIEHKEDAFMSRTLGTIDIDAPIDFDLAKYKKKEFNNDELYKIFKRLEFNTFIKRLNLTVAEDLPSTYEIDVDKFDEIENFEALTKRLTKGSKVAIFIDKLNSLDEINKIGFCDEVGAFVYKLSSDKKRDLKYIFENDEIEKYTINLKEIYLLFLNHDINIKAVKFDLAIAEYVLDPTKGDYELNKIAEEKFGLDLSNISGAHNTQMSLFGASENEDNAKLLAASSKVLFNAYKLDVKEIEDNNLSYLFNEIEMPLVEILANMQYVGIGIEKNELSEYGKILNEKIENLSSEIKEIAGCDFNINSPKQLGEILFDKMGLDAGKKTTRGYSTDAETLEKLRDESPIIDKILMYKQLSKVKSTYVDGLVNVIDSKTGRIHSNFKQTVTATGRLSSAEPNLQNIPIKLEVGRLIRKMFVAKDGYKFIDADYSQIELRILASLSNDETMIAAFNNDEDIHTSTAMKIFNIPREEVTKEKRAKAKAVNFGIVYGQGDFSLSQDLSIPKKEAKAYIDEYFKHFSKIKIYLDGLIKSAKETGYAKTLYNRRRRMDELKSSNFHMRSFGERASMNMPIQGTAADIIKIAMIKVFNNLRGMKSKLVLQVHDELIVEAAEDEIEKVENIVRKSMEEAATLAVKLKVELNVGKTWFEAK